MKMNICRPIFRCAVLLTFLTPFIFVKAYAQQESSESGLDEFDIDIDALLEDSKDTSYSFNGFIQTEVAYSYLSSDPNYEFTRKDSGMSKLQTTLNLSYEQKIFDDWKLKANANLFYDAYYEMEGRDKFPEETLDVYEKEVELRDTYIEGPITDNLWLKFGKQINAWGEADFSQVLSIGNPVDIRELGRTDIVDALVPVTATKLVFNYKGWLFDAVAVHEVRGNKIATEGSELDTYIYLRNPNVQIQDTREIEDEFDNTEALFRVFKAFNNGDVSLIYADVYTKQPHLEFSDFSVDNQTIVYTPEYERIQALGFAGNYVTGSWLLKAEFARKQGVPISRIDIEEQIAQDEPNITAVSEKDVFEGVVGFSYAGAGNFTLSMESFLRKINDYEENLALEENSWTHTLMITRDFLRQRLHFQFLVTHVPVNDKSGEIIRIGTSYDFTDDLILSFGAIFYQSNDVSAPFYPYRHNDNVFTSIRYYF